MPRLSLLLFVLAVPVITYLVGGGVRGKIEGDWSGVVVRELGQQAASRSGVLALSAACTSATLVNGGLASTCDEYNQIGALQGTAVAAGLASAGLLVMIYVAGQAARRRRNVLVALFGPGLHITAWILTALVLADAGLAIAALYFGERVLIGRLHVGIILAIGLGALAGAGTLVRASQSVVRTAESSVFGVLVDPSEDAGLFAFVHGLADELGAGRPQHIVVGLEPNYFVTEVPVRHLDGVCTGRTLFLSLPLSRLLSRGELRAILGHEMGHFRGLDTQFSQRFFPIYRGSVDALRELAAVYQAGGARAISVLPALAVMSYFLDCFAVAEREISRDRELAADEVGAEATSPAAIATALVKVVAFSRAWEPTLRAGLARLAEKRTYSDWNVSQTFVALVNEAAAGSDLFRDLDNVRLPHPTDSHPPLAQRLAALGIDLDAIQETARIVDPYPPAADLVQRVDELEARLSATIAQRLGGLVPGAPARAEASASATAF